MSIHATGHWDAMVQILRYIKGPKQELLYKDKGNTQIVGYCDADQVLLLIDGSPQGIHLRVLCLCQWKYSLIVVKIKMLLQGLVQKEYKAMATISCELIWINQFLQALKFGDT